MLYYGQFQNRAGEAFTLLILTEGSAKDALEIGSTESGLYFAAEEAACITAETNDTLDVLLPHSLSLRLLTDRHRADLFARGTCSVPVNLFRGSSLIFAGYVEPQAYQQPFNETLDELELNCIDALSASQYDLFRHVRAAGVDYEAVKAAAKDNTFAALITELLTDATAALNIPAADGFPTTPAYLQSLHVPAAPIIWFDESITLPSDNSENSDHSETTLSRATVSELLFLGDEEDDTWTAQEVLEEMLRYLNLHALQRGRSFYLFSWKTIRAARESGVIRLRRIDLGSSLISTVIPRALTNQTAADTDTQMSIGETFNVIELTCETQPVEGVIESPLDSDALSSPFSRYQKYCTEYRSEGEGVRAHKAFSALLFPETDSADVPYYWENASTLNHFIRVRQNDRWKFSPAHDPATLKAADLLSWKSDLYAELLEKDTDGNYINQQTLPTYLSDHRTAALLSFGTEELNAAQKDNSPTAKISMQDTLLISVNGTGTYNKKGEINTLTDAQAESTLDTLATRLRNAAPVAWYEGNKAGGTYSPTDDETTNYIVFSGRLILNPVMQQVEGYHAMIEKGYRTISSDGYYGNGLVYCRNNGDGQLYTRQYLQAEHPTDTPQTTARDTGITPFSDKGPQALKFKYSKIVGGYKAVDNCSKIPVLSCMLIIGEKCCVETFGSDGAPSAFTWQPFRNIDECRAQTSTEDEALDMFYGQSFSLGIDPKIDDQIIGTEYSLQNNISYTLGLDTEGTAIPIRKSDHVKGRVRFIILGPYNAVWNDVTRIHPTMFRHTTYKEKDVPLLHYLSNIIIRDFKAELHSDNALFDIEDENDLIYSSDTDETFLNRKDDLSLRIHSALTSDERKTLGVRDCTGLSTAYDALTGEGILQAIDTYDTATPLKPERLIVDTLYRELHTPHIILEHSLRDENANTTPSYFSLYTHPAHTGKTFYPTAISQNLQAATARLTMKEI